MVLINKKWDLQKCLLDKNYFIILFFFLIEDIVFYLILVLKMYLVCNIDMDFKI